MSMSSFFEFQLKKHVYFLLQTAHARNLYRYFFFLYSSYILRQLRQLAGTEKMLYVYSSCIRYTGWEIVIQRNKSDFFMFSV